MEDIKIKKGDKLVIDLGFGDGIETVEVVSKIDAGNYNIQFVVLKKLSRFSAPYTITYPKLIKSIK
jgi:hypothetical protein